ncbi:MAG: nucleotidyltransferase substrate binding protein [Magnetococcales bacterium]|nr:nucleotidyltransferase substrate binding protein [Magnetococcales bacterium]
MIDYRKFEQSLHHLQRQYDNRVSLDTDLPELMREAVDESVIKRFEVCYDCLWKVLKRYLHVELGLPEVPSSPKPIFRMANENGLLPSAIEQWLNYANARIGTTHDYSNNKAALVLELAKPFITDAIQLYQTMTTKEWS